MKAISIAAITLAAATAGAGTIYGPGGSSWTGSFQGSPQPSGNTNDDHRRNDSPSNDGPRGPKPPSWKDNQARGDNSAAQGVAAYKRGQDAWGHKDVKHLDTAIAEFRKAERFGNGDATSALAKALNAKAVHLFEAGAARVARNERAKGLADQEQALALVQDAIRHDAQARYTQNEQEMRERMNELWCDVHKPLEPHNYTGTDDDDFHTTQRRACWAKQLAAGDQGWNCNFHCEDNTDF